MRDPEVSGPLVANGFEVVASTPAEFGAQLAKDLLKYEDVVKRSGAKLD